MALPDNRKEGAYVLRLDGATTWMATAPCYDDLQLSPVGFGKTEQEAVDDLVQKPEFQAFLRRTVRTPPTLKEFIINQQAIRIEAGERS